MDATKSIKRHITVGIVAGFLLIGGAGGWAATTQIAGAIVAPGKVIVDSNVKRIQHPTGGVVGEILVQNGSRIKSGSLLLKLDATVTQANLSLVSKTLTQLRIRRARLAAERDNLDTFEVPVALLLNDLELDFNEMLEDEKRLFDLRRKSRVGQVRQLEQRIEQFREEESGLVAQIESKQAERRFIGIELKGARNLWKKKLIALSRKTAIERQAVKIDGELAAFLAEVAKIKGGIIEIRLKINQVDRDLAAEVANEMREIDTKIGELVEKRIAANDKLKRIEIRAPQDGVVHGSTVHTVGGVISAGDILMYIVPQSDELSVEVHVDPNDIEQIKSGQNTLIRFTSFDVGTTPEIEGAVKQIAADTTTDKQTGVEYYTVRVTLSSEEIAKMNGAALVPGMPVETYFQTGDRDVISYLMKPLTDQMNRTFRD